MAVHERERASHGLKVELTVDAAEGCPVANVAKETDTTIDAVTWTTTADGTVVEDFHVDRGDGEAEPVTPVDEVFSTDSTTTYRFERENGCGCVCDQLGADGIPVSSVRAADGDLHLTFYVGDLDVVKESVATLREHFDNVGIKRLSRTNAGDGQARDLVTVERGRLTDRQLEVLETAHRMGYFEHPRGANAGDVADALDISRSTFTEHLAAAQSKILAALLD